MRPFVIVPLVFFLFIILIAAAVIAPSFIDWNAYKEQARQQITNFTGYEILLKGEIGGAFLPTPHIYANDVEVKLPARSEAEQSLLMRFKKLSLNIETAPLLSGSVIFSSISFIEPEFNISKLADGSFDWITPTISACLNKSETDRSRSGFLQSISVDKVSISNGAVRYVDVAQSQSYVLKSVTARLSAQSLQGPFSGEGQFSFNGEQVAFDFKTGGLNPDSSSLSINANLELDAYKAGAGFAGVVSYGEMPQMQGEVYLAFADLERLNPVVAQALEVGSANFKGLVTANPARLDFKNVEAKVGDYDFDLALTGQADPWRVNADINLEKGFVLPVPARSAGAQPLFSLTSPGGFLPQTLPVALPLEVAADISVPFVTYQGQNYESVRASVSMKDSAVLFEGSIGKLPGGGNFTADARLNYPEKGQTDEGQTVLTAPRLDIGMKAAFDDWPLMLETVGATQSVPAFLSESRTASLDFRADIKTQSAKIITGVLQTGGERYEITGSLDNGNIDAVIRAFNGRAELTGGIQEVEGRPALAQSTLRLEHPNLANLIERITKSPSDTPFLSRRINWASKLAQDGNQYSFTDINAELGQARFLGSLSADLGGEKPALQADISFSELLIDPVQAGQGSVPGAGGETRGRWSAAPIDLSWLQNFDLNANIKGQSLHYETWRLSNPAVEVTVKDGVMDIQKLQAGMYGGTLDMSARISGQASPVSVKAGIALDRVSVGQLVTSFVGSPLIIGQGEVNLNTEITATGNTQADLVNSLAGQGTTTGKNLLLQGFDLSRFARALSSETKPGDTLLGIWKGSIKGGSTRFNTMDGVFTIANGVVNLNKLDLDGPKAFLASQGQISLPRWSLSTVHNVTLKEREDIPSFEMKFNGPLDNPAQTFAEGALRDYLSRKINRKLEKLLTDKLGLPSRAPPPQEKAPEEPGSEAPPQQQTPRQGQGNEPQGNTPEEALRGLLEGLVR